MKEQLENILWRIYCIHDKPHSAPAVIRQSLEEIMALLFQEDKNI